VYRIALVIAVALAFAPQAATASKQASGKFLPARGILHPGKSLAGVSLGDTKEAVLQRWGANHKSCGQCRVETWYYIYPQGEPLGAAVRFKKGKVVTVFTLGSPTGWRTAQGLLMGQQVDKVRSLYGDLRWTVCIGYGAMSMRSKESVTSIYTTGENVYGFALARPTEPVCN
jgi:hypothetical protein